MKPTQSPTRSKSEFLDSVQKGLLLGAAVVALVMPPSLMVARKGVPGTPQTHARVAAERGPARLADFGSVVPTDEVRELANWSVHVGDNQRKSFVILDKKDARVYIFDSRGRLKAHSPVLLGYAVGDDNAPGIGLKAIADVLPEERTTPAGRFVAEVGMNARGEDVVWVDYAAAVSMHRVLTTNPAERRLERLATPTSEDNRVSYGCINLPTAFYEQVLAPTVTHGGAIIYVLPETRSAQEVFGSYDVTQSLKVAKR
jgi:hypothetical protein